MNKFLTIVFVMLSYSPLASAGTASCGLIQDHDIRMMCMATGTGNSSYCSFIKSQDLRIRCFAQLGK